MAGRPGPRSQEGMYVSSSPISDQDPFSNAQAADGRYYDNDSDNYNRRDTYMSDSSQNGLNDDDRYYDHHGAYDPYGEFARSQNLPWAVFSHSRARKVRNPTPILRRMSTQRSMRPLQNRFPLHGWACRRHRHLRSLTPLLVQENHTRPGAPNARYLCRRKRLRISSSILPRSSASSATPCGIWCVVVSYHRRRFTA